jgi:hypothetical protein
VNAKHPEHNNWVKQQKHGNGKQIDQNKRNNGNGKGNGGNKNNKEDKHDKR